MSKIRQCEETTSKVEEAPTKTVEAPKEKKRKRK
jgi:hypothetical protein